MSPRTSQEKSAPPEKPAGPPEKGGGGPPGMDDIEFPSRAKALTIVGALYLAIFLIAIDRTIIATAIPAMTNEFKSLDQVGWYGSAFLMTTCAFQLVAGKLYTFYPIKPVFLSFIGLFEVGSALCGAAPSSEAFIIGRAVAGLGCAGVMSGGMTIIVFTVPLHKRPMYTGFVGGIMAIASVLGPLLGGVFTDHVTWRWCFYINLPIGGVAMVIIFFILQLPPNPRQKKVTLKQLFFELDPLGTLCFLPSMVCLVLALQWGGSTYAWSNWRIILLLTLFGVLIIGFVAVQIQRGDRATLPMRIATQRSVVAGALYQFCAGAGMMVFIYYLPLWFQAVEGVSAETSGIRTLALVLPLVAGSMSAGIIVRLIGYYVPLMIVGSVVSSVGAGLLTTLHPGSSRGEWIGFQLLYGLGLGLGMQQSNVAVQTVLPRQDVPIGSSFIFFIQSLTGTIFISVGQNVLSQKLLSGLAPILPSDIHFSVDTGATDIRHLVPAALLPQVLDVYNHALVQVFRVACGLVCGTVFGWALMEWRSVKAEKKAADAKKLEEGRRSEEATKEEAEKGSKTELSSDSEGETPAAAEEKKKVEV